MLGVRSLDYYVVVNSNLRLENQSLTKMNAVNVAYIEQLEGDLSHLRQVNEGLSEELNEGLRAKKKWRNATLLIGSIYVFTAAIIYLQ